MVSFLSLHLATSYGQTVLWVVGQPSYLVARCSSVGGIVQPIDYFVLTGHQSVDDMLTIYSALSLELGIDFS